MKNLFITLLSFSVPFSLAAQKSKKTKENVDYAIIEGVVKNPTQTFVVVEKLIQPVIKRDTVQLDSNGKFFFKTEALEKIQSYRVAYGNRIKVSDTISIGTSSNVLTKSYIDKVELLLNKGFKLMLEIDATGNPKNNRIKGVGAEMCTYYNQKIEFNQTFQSGYGRLLRAPKDTFLAKLNQYEKNSLSLIETKLKTIKNVPADYLEKEKFSLKYNVYRMKTYLAYSQINRFQNDSIISQFNDKYFEFLKTVPFTKTTTETRGSYNGFINVLVDYYVARNSKGAKLDDSTKFKHKYQIYKSMFKPGELRNFQMYDLLFLNNSRATESWYENAVNDFNKISTNDSLKNEINNILEVRKKMAKGKQAYDFTVYDIDGKSHKLSDFKGKYVYIDTWATWCKPCVQQIPYLKKVEDDYHGKNIVFISVSIDNDSTRWRKYVQNKNLTGHQFWVGNDKTKGYCKEFIVQGIPRFMFIDPDGKFIDASAPRPSMPELMTLFRTFKELRITLPQNNANPDPLSGGIN